MKENVMICNCKQVSYADIAKALNDHSKMEDAIKVFEDVQNVTSCTTGCGGCYHKVLDVISEVLNG